MNNYTKAGDSAAKYYNDLLLNQICSVPEDHMEEQKNYIAAFSQYLCKSSPAYAYNLSYLLLRHEEFCKFLHNAREKYQAFCRLLQKIAATDAAKALKKQKPEEYAKIRVVFNDLLEGQLDGSICFTEDFSVFGANCRENDDVFAVCYENQRRSGYAAMDTERLEMLVQSVLSVPKERANRW